MNNPVCYGVRHGLLFNEPSSARSHCVDLCVCVCVWPPVVRNPPGWEVGLYLVGFLILLAVAGLNIWKLWKSGTFPTPSPFPNFDYRYLQEKYGNSFSEVRQKVPWSDLLMIVLRSSPSKAQSDWATALAAGVMLVAHYKLFQNRSTGQSYIWVGRQCHLRCHMWMDFETACTNGGEIGPLQKSFTYLAMGKCIPLVMH